MEQQSDEWTIGRLLTWTTEYLTKHGADSPRLEAEVLLAHSRGCKRIELYTSFAEIADEKTRERFRELVRRRAAGEPVAYLVGHREFYSLDFRVTPDVLIPRPETELLVMRLVELVKQEFTGQQQPRIVDLGTGSGVIAVCAAKYIAGVRVTAIDSSAAALAVARENATAHGITDRIEFIESDLFADVPASERYHLVASNPPYVSQSEFDGLPGTIREFEPSGALLAGPKGTEVIERIIGQASERLLPGGWLLVEISPTIAAEVKRITLEHGGYESASTIKDLVGKPRVVQARRR